MTPSSSPAARLFLAAEMDTPEALPVAGGRVWVYSCRAPEKETGNEDGAAVIPLGEQAAVLAVADGVGGLPAGHQAAAAALRALQTALATRDSSEATARIAILDGIEQANQAVLALGLGAATTLSVAEVQGATLRTYQIGDSGVLLLGQRGKLKSQTLAHSPVGFALEAGLLNEREALHHEARHLVSNVVGTPDMRIDVGSRHRIAPRDTLLLASDGLFDNLRMGEIVRRIRKGPGAAAARAVVEESRRRMARPAPGEPHKPDDLTVMLYRPAHR